MYLNPKQSLSREGIVLSQKGKGGCPCIYWLTLYGLYYKELGENCKTDEEIYNNIRTLKEKLNHQELFNVISDRAPRLKLYSIF